MKKNFIKVIENFVCDHCGHETIGTGYTNHCPECLYSKHVDDLVPGDRVSTCKGLMTPIGIEIKSGQYLIHHLCLKCFKLRKNQTSPNDNQQIILKLSSKPIPIKK